jgi:hypothetical protein
VTGVPPTVRSTGPATTVSIVAVERLVRADGGRGRRGVRELGAQVCAGAGSQQVDEVLVERLGLGAESLEFVAVSAEHPGDRRRDLVGAAAAAVASPSIARRPARSSAAAVTISGAAITYDIPISCQARTKPSEMALRPAGEQVFPLAAEPVNDYGVFPIASANCSGT